MLQANENAVFDVYLSFRRNPDTINLSQTEISKEGSNEVSQDPKDIKRE